METQLVTNCTSPPKPSPPPTPRSDAVAFRGAEERSFHGSMPRLNRPPSTHSSHQHNGRHSRHNSQPDVSEAPPTLITHGTTTADPGPTAAKHDASA